MSGSKDMWVIIGILLIAGLWAYIGLRKWLHSPYQTKYTSVPISSEIKESIALQLLERDGYDVIGGRIRIPFHLIVNQIQYDSRLFVDYVARQGNNLFIVKVARDRVSGEWTASGVRNRLLPYFLLYSDVDGILYVDEKEQHIYQIHFQLEEE